MNLILAAERRRLGGGSLFLGEVLASEFITGDALAVAMSFNAGFSQNTDEPWLKFNLDGKTLLVAKKPLRHSITYDQLATNDLIYGTRTIQVHGKTYKVRLMKGAGTDPYIGNVGSYDTPGTYGSEWNRLFYPLVPNPYGKPATGISGEGIVFGEWANYTEGDLSSVSGYICWCQERRNANTYIGRRNDHLTRIEHADSNYTNRGWGWRPVLELID